MKIEPQKIVDLYKKHNFQPICGAFMVQPMGKTCPLGILYLDANGRLDKHDDPIYHWANTEFGAEYSAGLWHGFDTPTNDYSNCHPEFFLGVNNGIAIREACLIAFPEFAGKI